MWLLRCSQRGGPTILGPASPFTHALRAPEQTATAAITNGATDSTWVVTWVDGPAATSGTVRQCHTDYNLIFGYRTSAAGTVYTYEFPPPTVTVDSPAIVISNLWKTLTTAGPYHRTATVTSNYVWEAWTDG